MEAGEQHSSNINLKRQRAPLSDSEDNVFLPSEVNDGQKRRRFEAADQENRSPKPSSSGCHPALEKKPDTPIVPSVRSRVQQLTQRQDGEVPLAQRCLSDPGAESPSVFPAKGFRENLLGQGEFQHRVERFKVPLVQASPAPSQTPTNQSPRTCSNFVSGIQQKLQGITTPSSQQASRIREERKQELSRLQSISENAWMKRSNSDPSLNQQAEDDAEMKDGSFTEVLVSGAEKKSSNGKSNPCDSDTSAASTDLENSNEEQIQMQCKQEYIHRVNEVREEQEQNTSFGNEGSQRSQTQTVLKLSFSEDQSFLGVPLTDLNLSGLPTGDEHTQAEESNMEETSEDSKAFEQGRSEMSSFKEAEETHRWSYSEEEIEPSTDEELRLWQYPQEIMCKEKESSIAEKQEEDECVTKTKGDLKSSIMLKASSVLPDIQDSKFYMSHFSAEIVGSSKVQENEKHRPEEKEFNSESCLDDPVKDGTLCRDQGNNESCKGCYEGALSRDMGIFPDNRDHKKIDQYGHKDELYQHSNEILAVGIKEVMDLRSDRQDGKWSQTVAPALKETQTKDTELDTNIAVVAKPKLDTQAGCSDIDGSDGAQHLMESQVLHHDLEEMEQDAMNGKQGVVKGFTKETHKAEGGERSKKVTFILEPELINDSMLSESSASMESTAKTCMSDGELSSLDETNTAEIIDQMFGEVLEYAGMIEDERVENDEDIDHDSGIGACSGDKDKIRMESEKEKSEVECDERKTLESNGDELLTFPPSGILSPLSKSVEAVVTPLRLAVSQESDPPSLLLTPEETSIPLAESAPLYSVDAYRTQRQSKNPTIQSVTPGVQRRAPQKSQPQPSVNTKEKIMALNEEAGKLQNVINQTLQALSCCTDEDHGRGSLEEAEAEKLLLVSCEKRSALLTEVTRLKEEVSSESEGAIGEDRDNASQQPCRGTVSITNIQLPLKLEFVCCSHNRPGRPSHYFFVLIRYGPCNIVATPLATAADVQNGDTISFPTSVTLKDIRSSFEIDVEVYSLSHSSSNCSMDRTVTKSRVTPRKLLNTITRSSNTLTSAAPPALSGRRSSNFCLVGSHKITLASLGNSKFPLDKMKLEGKIRRLLGDEFQEKVPFLSPLEGHIYLQLDSQGHSDLQHQGFLTMFELISGFGVWHRRYFVLEGCIMHYWNHPNDRETKAAEGSICLSSSPSQSVRPVERDLCARPFTFELVSNTPQQQQDKSQDTLAKCWFSADTKQERLDWMEKLGQALLDFHTWTQTSATQADSQQSNTSSSGNLRESIL